MKRSAWLLWLGPLILAGLAVVPAPYSAGVVAVSVAADSIKCPKCKTENPAKGSDGKETAQCRKCGYSLKKYAADKGPDKIDVSGYAKPMQDAYNKVFVKKCSKCHTLARPINSKFTDEHWKKYIKRMQRKPGSGITSNDAKAIYEFIEYHFRQQKGKK